ncbi:MAG TPA: tRNA threonylcarbamoyladenosine dehydratase [Anaeromyxobacteraceae bacterium]|nr:tRNA threonylcarbamoyladenosine dehydratase [Anaeromyxobacteraceae bacterium]
MDRPLPLRLDRTARLLGLDGVAALQRAHVVVLGLGGVGSFTAEALARAGVGRLTLVDGERVEQTNANRQLHALDGEFGRFKAEVLAERARRINPAAEVQAICERYDESTAERIVSPGTSFVVDAIDTVVAKLHVVARCLELGVPIVTVLGAARRLDPTAIQVTDLSESHTDQLAKDVRKYLRRHHGIAAASGPTGVLAVWSVEEPRPSLTLPGDEHGIPGARAPSPGERRRGPKVFGSAAFATGAFGLAAAAAVVQRLTGATPRTHRVLAPPERARRRKRSPAR